MGCASASYLIINWYNQHWQCIETLLLWKKLSVQNWHC